ncbi:MAG: protein kinase [Bryobacteraceae bacterium]
MLLSVGDRLGPYEIVASLGEGGMGQVYRARDTRLQREVAVKVSSEQFSERFAREAQLIAALNHPNICTLFDVGPNYLVMELIEGPTLYDRMAQGAMPLEEAVPVAVQIAEALEAAHEKGIVHRDLKPANIKLTADGKVKVLDFGLAKALEAEPSAAPSLANSPTLAPTRVAATQAGFILGTAGYMAPEQARGHAVDRRADIFAYGVVLWEMVTGRRMFDGETVSDTLALILTQTPQIDAAPQALRPLLTRCLEKDRKKRLQAIGEARIALEAPVAAVEQVAGSSRIHWQLIAGVSTAALVVCLALLLKPARQAEKQLIALDVDMGTVLGSTFAAGSSVVLSPDGTRIAYLDGSRRLWTRRLNDTKAVMLAANPVQGPFFSPDSRWIGYFDTKLRKVLADGGTAIELMDLPAQGRGGTWADDGWIYFAMSSTPVLFRIPDSGGTAQAVTQIEAGRKEVLHRFPYAIPGGRAVLFTASKDANVFDDATIDVIVPATGERKTLIRGGTHPCYLASGHILYANRATVFAIAFDAKRLAVSGSPIPILQDVFYQANIGYMHLSASREGTLVYRRSNGAVPVTARWLDASGKAGDVVLRDLDGTGVRVSPNGQRIAFRKQQSIWLVDGESGNASRLTFDRSYNPVFTPNGAFVVYGSENGVFVIGTDGGGKPVKLLDSDNPNSISPDGKFLLTTGASNASVATLQQTAHEIRVEKTAPLYPEERNVTGPEFSPDGKWIAFRAVQEGRQEVCVRAFPDTGARYQISQAGGSSPVWSLGKKELLWISNEGKVVATPYSERGNSLTFGATREFTDVRVTNPGISRILFAAPRGRFLMTSYGDAGLDRTAVFLFHFYDLLKRRMAAAGSQPQ